MTETVRLITFPGAPNLPIFLGVEDGHFERAGVTIEHTMTPKVSVEVFLL